MGHVSSASSPAFQIWSLTFMHLHPAQDSASTLEALLFLLGQSCTWENRMFDSYSIDLVI
jgi:hypothetical protein